MLTRVQISKGTTQILRGFAWPMPAGFAQALSALTKLAAKGDRISVLTVLANYTTRDLLSGLARAPDVVRILAGLENGLLMNRERFCAEVVQKGYLPLECPQLAPVDFDWCRTFVLKVREAPPAVTALGWEEAATVAAAKRFFPEKAWNGLSPRDAVIAAATYAAEVGMPHTDRQAALFSLGGRFDFGHAYEMTRPQGGATTCILVARGVLHAAGFNVLRKDTLVYVKGLFADLPQKEFGYNDVRTNTDLPNPLPGDIFHIQGKDYGEPKKDSSHVGIITSVNNNVWETVEGGGGDHKTTKHVRTLIRADDKEVTAKYGQWRFNDDKFTAGQRALSGWYDLAKIDRSRSMTRNADIIGPDD